MTQPDNQQQDGGTSQQGGDTGGQQHSGQQQGDKGGQQDTTPKFTQADYNRFEAQIRREYSQKAERDKALIEKGKEYETLLQESRPLSERVEVLSGTLAEKDQTIAEKDLAHKRLSLAYDAGLPPALGRRVQGNTEEEIKADIEDLRQQLPQLSVQQQQGSHVRPNPQQGVPSTGDTNRTGSVEAGKSLWAQRHGKKTDAAV